MNKRLWLKEYKFAGRTIRMWHLRDFTKAFPVCEYFWDNPEWLIITEEEKDADK